MKATIEIEGVTEAQLKNLERELDKWGAKPVVRRQVQPALVFGRPRDGMLSLHVPHGAAPSQVARVMVYEVGEGGKLIGASRYLLRDDLVRMRDWLNERIKDTIPPK